ncbi:MAG TPA: cation diffusion facilitator family transporter [Longimicrobiales bacterium]|nr:cation diffusion facilitator family transporter [Longimicrobiales bacterium]
MKDSRTARGIGAAQLALAVNAAMVAAKVTTGLLGSSYALVADGVESTLDIFSSLIVWRGLAVAGRHPDEHYHFGYGKAESLAGAAVATMLLVAALGISIQAVREILTPQHAPAPYTLVVLVVVIAVKALLSRWMMDIGREVGSAAVKADAWHHRADAITSAAAFAGISVALIGGPGWAPADDVAALVASGIIAFNGIRLLRPALEDLMDRAPDPNVLARVDRAASSVPGVLRVEKIQARRAGIGHFVTLHVEADPEMTLRTAHALGHTVKDAVQAELPDVLDVLVHMEPFGGRGGLV